jgi:hypothetical protein
MAEQKTKEYTRIVEKLQGAEIIAIFTHISANRANFTIGCVAVGFVYLFSYAVDQRIPLDIFSTSLIAALPIMLFLVMFFLLVIAFAVFLPVVLLQLRVGPDGKPLATWLNINKSVGAESPQTQRPLQSLGLWVLVISVPSTAVIVASLVGWHPAATSLASLAFFAFASTYITEGAPLSAAPAGPWPLLRKGWFHRASIFLAIYVATNVNVILILPLLTNALLSGTKDVPSAASWGVFVVFFCFFQLLLFGVARNVNPDSPASPRWAFRFSCFVIVGLAFVFPVSSKVGGAVLQTLSLGGGRIVKLELKPPVQPELLGIFRADFDGLPPGSLPSVWTEPVRLLWTSGPKFYVRLLSDESRSGFFVVPADAVLGQQEIGRRTE